MNEWPWNKFPDTKSQWETCLKEHKKALEEIKTLRAKLYPNTVAREGGLPKVDEELESYINSLVKEQEDKFPFDPMQPVGTKSNEKHYGD